MRVLKFIVSNGTIKPDPLCNFNGLFPGKNDNIKAEFIFSPEWLNAVKVIAFWSISGDEYEPQLLDEQNACKIPIEALQRPAFKIQVLGKKNNVLIATNRLSVYQRGGTA